MGDVADDIREAARLHVLSCVEQIMPMAVFHVLVQSIPEHPAHFRDSHPIRMVTESIRARHTPSELREFFQSVAWDWDAW